ncbi:MAG: glycosyltransferase family 2 protein [Armatimonadota bacterium]
MKVCAVVPAYNEGERILPVLDTLASSPCVHEIFVVDDGSLDNTYEVIKGHPACKSGRVQVLQHNPNRGKGAAMRTGAEATNADVLVFFDADLIGLTPPQVESVVGPVVSGKAAMSLGVFRGGRGWTTLAQILVPNISGQRAIRRDVFQAIPCLTKAGYGVELAITNYVIGEGLPMARVVLQDVTHPMKEEKLGFLRGARARFRMYWQMLPYMIRSLSRRRKNRLR